MSDTKKSKKKAREHKENELPEHLEMQRTRVICGPEMNYHVNTVTSALAYMSLNVDNSWNHDAWASAFEINITSMKGDTMEFEMINIDPALANAFRRVLISEVPTVAIEHVFVVNNTSIMQEEVLAHRLGLVPLAVEPERLALKGETADETNTVVFKLHVECKRGPDGAMLNSHVTSKHLQWLPEGSEYPDETSTRFTVKQNATLDAKPVHDDVLLCKMRPGQCIELEAHAIVGIGDDHAKWSPVSTAWYRLYPEVVTLKEVPQDVAAKLAKEVPDVFSVDKGGKLIIENVRHHEIRLEKIRTLSGFDAYKDYIQVRKRKQHFIFTIESVGSLTPVQTMQRALDILKRKCVKLNNEL